MSKTNPAVDKHLRKAKHWRDETEALRSILLDGGLTEELKWGQPCYTFQNSNIAIIQGFKKNCALMFFKGALLKDASGVLEKPGENSQAARRIPFTSTEDIVAMESKLKTLIREAVKVEKAGLEVNLEAKTKLEFPRELRKKMDENPELKAAFEALTPGRQRGYNLHFSGAKQSKTRESRIEKCIPRILEGRGLNDR